MNLVQPVTFTPSICFYVIITSLKSSIVTNAYFVATLQWRHNERDGVTNHRCLGCLLNRLLSRKSKKTSKLRVTGLCEGNSPVTGGHKGPVVPKMQLELIATDLQGGSWIRYICKIKHNMFDGLRVCKSLYLSTPFFLYTRHLVKYVCNWFFSSFVPLMSSFVANPCDLFTHILQGCFSDLVRLP